MFGIASFFSSPAKSISYLHEQEQPLLTLSADNDVFSLGEAFEGVQIFGGTGSGKTSGSGRALAHAFLKSGFGGLVLCAKPGECDLWRRYAKECNRLGSLVIMDGNSDAAFNFLDYELARIDAGANIDNVVSVFMNIMEAKKGKRQSTQENPFWKDASREYLSNAIELLHIAYGKVELLQLFQLSQSLPKSMEEMQNTDFQQRSFFFQTIFKISNNPVYKVNPQDLAVISNYFAHTFATLDQKTKSNLIVTLSSMLSPFMKGKMRALFADKTTIVPEMSHEGAIIIIDLPLKTWEQTGIVGQQIFKYAWQRATERRMIEHDTRPVFLWADESHLFVSDYDKEFQSTARSSKACSVYLTQSLPAYVEALGSEYAAYEFLTNFQTKIFHSNTDPKTNQYAAEMVGKWAQYRHNYSDSRGSSHSTGDSYSESLSITDSWGGSTSPSGMGGTYTSNTSSSRSTSKTAGINSSHSTSSNHSDGATEVIDYLLQPAFFASSLRKGGRKNGYFVGGVIMTGGNIYYNRTPFLITNFEQT